MPGHRCPVKDCNSTQQTNGITFHRFPNREPELQKWIDFVDIPNFAPTPNQRMCNLHFLDSQYVLTKNGKKLIRDSAVPSVYSVGEDMILSTVTESEKTYSTKPSRYLTTCDD